MLKVNVSRASKVRKSTRFSSRRRNRRGAPRLPSSGNLALQQNRIFDGPLNVTGPVLTGVCVLALAGFATVPMLEIGPLSLQMLQHLAVMNVLAPLLALALPQSVVQGRGGLWIPAVLQLTVLWAWHMPSMQQLAAGSAVAQIWLMAMLAGAALWFWQAVIGAARAGGWSALGVLLGTGKLACLLGALLIFAPRDLYLLDGLALVLCAAGPSNLSDQQLAGLLMVTACPLSYLVVGVALAARMLIRLDGAERRADVSARAD